MPLKLLGDKQYAATDQRVYLIECVLKDDMTFVCEARNKDEAKLIAKALNEANGYQ